ncbi:MAG: LapA family protein [Pseudohongiellaceae bacterium]
MNLKVFIAIVFLVLTGIFVLQNMEVVQVNFLLWSLEASRVIIYLTIFLIGALVGWLGKSLRML